MTKEDRAPASKADEAASSDHESSPDYMKDMEPESALVECALHGTYKQAKHLMDSGVPATVTSLDPVTREYQTALGNAVWRGHYQLVKLFLKGGADPDHIDEMTDGPLLEAVNTDDTRMAILLLRAGADPNLDLRHQADFPSPMHAAMGPLCNDPEILRLLMQHRGDPGLAFYNEQITPLHTMAKRGGGVKEKAKLKLVLDREGIVDVDARDEDGYTPLETAACFNNKQTLSAMLSFQQSREADRHRCVHLASAAGHFGVVEYLIGEKFAGINDLCEDSTPLLAAADGGQWEMVQWILDHGGKTGPLHSTSTCPCQTQETEE